MKYSIFAPPGTEIEMSEDLSRAGEFPEPQCYQILPLLSKWTANDKNLLTLKIFACESVLEARDVFAKTSAICTAWEKLRTILRRREHNKCGAEETYTDNMGESYDLAVMLSAFEFVNTNLVRSFAFGGNTDNTDRQGKDFA